MWFPFSSPSSYQKKNEIINDITFDYTFNQPCTKQTCHWLMILFHHQSSFINFLNITETITKENNSFKFLISFKWIKKIICSLDSYKISSLQKLSTDWLQFKSHKQSSQSVYAVIKRMNEWMQTGINQKYIHLFFLLQNNAYRNLFFLFNKKN